MSAVARLTSALLTASALALAACGGGSDSSPPPPPPPPAAPTGLTATPFNGAVALAWTPVTGATSYNVYRSDVAGQPVGSMTFVAATINTELNAAAANGTTWYFRVTAVNAGGESPASGEASATPDAALLPPAPTGVTATAGDGSVTVAWDGVPDATSYRVYRSTSPGVTTVASYQVCSSPCTVSALANGTPYYFAVSAFVGGEESPLSTEVVATPRPLPYIDATAMMLAPGSLGGLGSYSVQVCTDSNCFTPVTNATVSIGGTALTWDAADEEYQGAPSTSIAGRTLDLVVTIPEGSAVASGTYRARGTMYTQAPKLTSPTSGTSWSASTSHTMTWTPGAPTGSSIYLLLAVNIANPFNGLVFSQVPVSQTSYGIPAGTLVTGSYVASVQIGPAGSSPSIPNTQAGSGFALIAGDMVLFSVTP